MVIHHCFGSVQTVESVARNSDLRFLIRIGSSCRKDSDNKMYIKILLKLQKKFGSLAGARQYLERESTLSKPKGLTPAMRAVFEKLQALDE